MYVSSPNRSSKSKNKEQKHHASLWAVQVKLLAVRITCKLPEIYGAKRPKVNNNNNNHSLVYAHIYSRPTAQVHTVSKYTQI